MTIDEIGQLLPNGFHDLDLLGYEYSYIKSTFTLTLTTNYDNHKMPFILEGYGCTIFVITGCMKLPRKQCEWITGFGRLTKEVCGIDLPESIYSDHKCHYFFLNESNSFIIFEAENYCFKQEKNG